MSIVRYALAGGLAGLMAGASVGLGEGLWIVAKAPQHGADAPLYGVALYAALTAPPGALLALLIGLRTHFHAPPHDPGDERTSPRARLAPDPLGWHLFAAFWIGLATVILRFRLLRDLFHERVPLTSPSGAALHGALLLGALLLGALAWRLLRPDGPVASRRWAPAAALIGLLSLLAALPPLALAPGDGDPTRPAAAAPHPNAPPTLLVMVDTLRADRLSPYGYAEGATPNLTRLAQDAVLFERAFAPAPWTRPSVASLLTGLRPSTHGAVHKDDRLADPLTTIAERLHQHGHATAGLVTNYNLAPYFNLQQGFTTYRYLEPDRFLWATNGATSLSLYRLARHLAARLLPHTADAPERHYWDARRATDAAIDAIDAWSTPAPFLFLTYMDPHDPYFAHPDDGTSFARVRDPNPDPALAAAMSQRYDQEVHHWDTHLGRLIAHLKRRGLYDATLLIVTSDHGEEFQEHGGWWHGTTLYEEQLHVPLLIKLPRQAQGGARRADLARLIDLPSTIAAAARVPPDPAWQGRDLFGDAPAPDAVLAETDHQGNAVRAARAAAWKLIEANPNNPRGLQPLELYDLDRDPDERHNLAPERPEPLRRLQRLLP